MSQTATVPSAIAEHLVSPAAYAEWRGINADLTYLRAHLPFAKANPKGYDSFWVATKHADVREISRQPEIFRSNGYRVILSSQAALAAMERPGAPPALRALITMDAPEHWVNRRLTFADFAPKGVKGLLVPKLVDEGVRWTSPLLNFMRTAAADYELRGQAIRKGDWIMMSYLSGNRDEDVFEDPFTFSLDRPENVHLGFGYGPHNGLGRNVARFEMRTFFEELFRRLTSVEMAGTPMRTHSANLSSIEKLPIRFTYT
jgi:cytochrome P450